MAQHAISWQFNIVVLGHVSAFDQVMVQHFTKLWFNILLCHGSMFCQVMVLMFQQVMVQCFKIVSTVQCFTRSGFNVLPGQG